MTERFAGLHVVDVKSSRTVAIARPWKYTSANRPAGCQLQEITLGNTIER